MTRQRRVGSTIVDSLENSAIKSELTPCIADEGRNQISLLCESDLAKPSEKLSKFREYYLKYTDAFNAWQVARENGIQVAKATSDLDKADENWMVYGYKGEVGNALVELEGISRNKCSQN